MKTALKTIARWIATVFVAPELASFYVRKQWLGADRALEGSSQTLCLIPGMTGAYLRTAFLRQVLAECDSSVRIEFGTLFSKASARLGRNCYVGPRCSLGLAHIEDDVLIAAGVQIPSGGHIHGTDDSDRPIREQAGVLTVVRIGAGTWIGANAVVMADVGRNCVIGAGSVVTRAIPDNVVAAGVPARVIRSRIATDVGNLDKDMEDLRELVTSASGAAE